jgi:phage shock protein B
MLVAVGMAVVFLIGGLVIFAALLLRRRGSNWRRSQEQSAEETRMIQAMYQQLSKMEERVEALETILADSVRKDAGK